MESQYDSTSRTPPIIIQLFCRLVRAKLDINNENLTPFAKLVVLLQTTLERFCLRFIFSRKALFRDEGVLHV